MRFCVGFAGIGVFDTGEGTHEITNSAAVKADRRQAVRVHAKAVAVGVVGAALVCGVGAAPVCGVVTPGL